MLVQGAQGLGLQTSTTLAVAALLLLKTLIPQFSHTLNAYSIHSSQSPEPGWLSGNFCPLPHSSPWGLSRRSPEAAQPHGHRLGSLSPIISLRTSLCLQSGSLPVMPLLCSHSDFAEVQICSCYSSVEKNLGGSP